MAIRDIVLFPNPVLTTRCPEVTEVTDEIVALVNDMAETMYAAPGIGLAAPQIGELQRIFIIDISAGDQPNDLRVFINPEILEKRGSITWEEGCLSFPGLYEKVQRSSYVRARALDIRGQSFEIEAEELLAVAIQHEFDHIDGVVYLDRVSRLKRKLALKRYQKLQKAAEAETESSEEDDE